MARVWASSLSAGPRAARASRAAFDAAVVEDEEPGASSANSATNWARSSNRVGCRKCSRAQSSPRSFMMGVPVSSSFQAML